jgi:UDP-glucose 4-epimerase
MGMKILITGGLGFLGHHLSRRLLRAYPDCELTLVDDLSSSRIDYAWLRGRAEVRIGDFLRWKAGGRRFDRIYHLASPVGSLGILARAGRIAKDITDLAVHAGETAMETGASLLYVSSSEVYGKPGIQSETDEARVPVASGARMEYLLGKLAGEHVLRNLSSRHGFRLTLVRPFNVLGEHQTARIGFVVPIFFERALSGEPLPLFYGGAQRRCFCHADDVAEGLVAVQEGGEAGGLYNLGNPGNRVSVSGLAERIRDLCESKSTLEAFDPGDRFGSQFLEASEKVPSIAKAAGLGWRPRIDLDEALRRVHRHYRTLAEGSVHAEHRPGIPGLADRHGAPAP